MISVPHLSSGSPIRAIKCYLKRKKAMIRIFPIRLPAINAFNVSLGQLPDRAERHGENRRKKESSLWKWLGFSVAKSLNLTVNFSQYLIARLAYGTLSQQTLDKTSHSIIFMPFFGHENWKTTAIFTGSIWLGVYLVFQVTMQVSLFGGILGLAW